MPIKFEKNTDAFLAVLTLVIGADNAGSLEAFAVKMNAKARELGMTTVLIDCPNSDSADYFLSSVMDVGPLVEALVNGNTSKSTTT